MLLKNNVDRKIVGGGGGDASFFKVRLSINCSTYLHKCFLHGAVSNSV